ncbi:hypothetical protein [Saccharospirillum salsuginis]|uniref:DUF1127 domain-containing protein n=1 Tax=Saccharospirillum salsuginis TaxID=418750 RepID=A0A918K521_9GAMM|nr:hypothetical protein [Saccharospirillum salsuginis]GGX47082.1 hypothetical protein GCM10007392_12350 [Saccharospirillum salsuginis]
MQLVNFFQLIQQRRALNKWLKEQREERFVAEHLNDHMQRDIGIGQQGVQAPLTWKEPKRETREQSRSIKERAGPSSA